MICSLILQPVVMKNADILPYMYINLLEIDRLGGPVETCRGMVLWSIHNTLDETRTTDNTPLSNQKYISKSTTGILFFLLEEIKILTNNHSQITLRILLGDIQQFKRINILQSDWRSFRSDDTCMSVIR